MTWVVKPDQLDEFVRSSQRGDSFVYHFGDLAFERLSFRRGFSLEYFDDRTVSTNGKLAWSFYEMGLVALVQRRIGEKGAGIFQYIMIKT